MGDAMGLKELMGLMPCETLNTLSPRPRLPRPCELQTLTEWTDMSVGASEMSPLIGDDSSPGGPPRTFNTCSVPARRVVPVQTLPVRPGTAAPVSQSESWPRSSAKRRQVASPHYQPTIKRTANGEQADKRTGQDLAVPHLRDYDC